VPTLEAGDEGRQQRFVDVLQPSTLALQPPSETVCRLDMAADHARPISVVLQRGDEVVDASTDGTGTNPRTNVGTDAK
jgi:hypothetical protein